MKYEYTKNSFETKWNYCFLRNKFWQMWDEVTRYKLITAAGVALNDVHSLPDVYVKISQDLRDLDVNILFGHESQLSADWRGKQHRLIINSIMSLRSMPFMLINDIVLHDTIMALCQSTLVSKLEVSKLVRNEERKEERNERTNQRTSERRN